MAINPRSIGQVRLIGGRGADNDDITVTRIDLTANALRAPQEVTASVVAKVAIDFAPFRNNPGVYPRYPQFTLTFTIVNPQPKVTWDYAIRVQNTPFETGWAKTETTASLTKESTWANGFVLIEYNIPEAIHEPVWNPLESFDATSPPASQQDIYDISNFYFRVAARATKDGQISEWTESTLYQLKSIDSGPPPPSESKPLKNFRAVAVAASLVHLAWDELDASAYYKLTRTGGGTNFESGVLTNAFYYDRNVEPETTYTWQLVGILNGLPGEPAFVTETTPEAEPELGAVSNLTVVASGHNQINISWTKPSTVSGISFGFTYSLERDTLAKTAANPKEFSQPPGGNKKLLDSSTSTSFMDTTVEPNLKYVYYVRPTHLSLGAGLWRNKSIVIPVALPPLDACNPVQNLRVSNYPGSTYGKRIDWDRPARHPLQTTRPPLAYEVVRAKLQLFELMTEEVINDKNREGRRYVTTTDAARRLDEPNLEANTLYGWAVRSTEGDCISEWQIVYSATRSNTLSPPINLNAIWDSANQEVDLSWTAPRSLPPGRGPLTYIVRRSVELGSVIGTSILNAAPWKENIAGTSTSDTAPVRASTMYYQVRAKWGVGLSSQLSDWTTPATTIAIPAGIGDLNLPRNVTATEVDDGIQVDWLAPSPTSGVTGRVGYIVKVIKATSGRTTFTTLAIDRADTVYTGFGLRAIYRSVEEGSRYCFFVRANQGQSTSRWTAPVCEVYDGSTGGPGSTIPAPTNKLKAPIGFRLLARGLSFASLTWSTPYPGRTVTYTLWRRATGESRATRLTDYGGFTGTTYTDRSVDQGKTYQYSVQTHTADGISGRASNYRYVTVTIQGATRRPVTSLRASAQGQGISVSWQPPARTTGEPIRRYTYQVRKIPVVIGSAPLVPPTNAITLNPSISVGRSGTYSFFDSDVLAGVLYAYYVRVVYTVGSGVAVQSIGGPWTKAEARVAVSTAPAKPTNLRATDRDTSWIQLEWNAVAGASRYDIYRTTDQRDTQRGLCSTPRIGSSRTTRYRDTGRSAGTDYWYAIRAVNSNNRGGPCSDSARATTKTVIKPTAPRNLRARYAAASSGVISLPELVSLTWDRPSDMNGVFQRYLIRVKSYSGTPSQSGISNGITSDPERYWNSADTNGNYSSTRGSFAHTNLPRSSLRPRTLLYMVRAQNDRTAGEIAYRIVVIR